MAQTDLDRGSLGPHEHLLDILVEVGLEVGYGDATSPSELQHFVLLHLKIGPVLRLRYPVDEDIEERLSLLEGDFDCEALFGVADLVGDLDGQSGDGSHAWDVWVHGVFNMNDMNLMLSTRLYISIISATFI